MATTPKKAAPAVKKAPAAKSVKPAVKAAIKPVKPAVKKAVAKAAPVGQFSESGKQPKVKFDQAKAVKEITAKKAPAKPVEKKEETRVRFGAQGKAVPISESYKDPNIEINHSTKTVECKKPTPMKKPAVKKAPAAKATPKVKESEVKEVPKGNKVTSTPPWENLPQQQAEAVAPPRAPKGFPFIPVYDGNSTLASYFSKTFEHNVTVNGEDFLVTTGYVAMHRSVDLFALSNYDPFISKGFINPKGHFDSNIKMTSLHITINDKDKFVNTENMAFNQFVLNPSGSYKDLSIEVTVIVRNGEDNHSIVVKGTINLEHGTAYLSSTSGVDVSVKGFMIEATRIGA